MCCGLHALAVKVLANSAAKRKGVQVLDRVVGINGLDVTTGTVCAYLFCWLVGWLVGWLIS